MVRLALAESFSESVTVSHEEYPYRLWELMQEMLQKNADAVAGGKFFEWRDLILTTIDDGSCGGSIGVWYDISAERALCDTMLAGGFVCIYSPNGGITGKHDAQAVDWGSIALLKLCSESCLCIQAYFAKTGRILAAGEMAGENQRFGEGQMQAEEHDRRGRGEVFLLCICRAQADKSLESGSQNESICSKLAAEASATQPMARWHRIVCAFDVSRDTNLKYGNHVVFDAGQKFAITLKDHPRWRPWWQWVPTAGSYMRT
eukprot:6181180-Pleurochrysis_carterae.AAC.3